MRNPLLGLVQELVDVTEIEASADSKLLQMLDQRGEERDLGRVHSTTLETQRSKGRGQSWKDSINIGLAQQEVAAGISSKAKDSDGLDDRGMSCDKLDNNFRGQLSALGQV